MSPTLLRRLARLKRDTDLERSWLFGYYRRELKMGRARAGYYTARCAYASPLEQARAGF